MKKLIRKFILDTVKKENAIAVEREVESYKLYSEYIIAEHEKKIKEIESIKAKNIELETKIDTIIQILGEIKK